jgi:inorganic pyrophosphatase
MEHRMNPTRLAAYDPQTHLVRVVIDTPAGSRNKYKFDPVTQLYCIARILPAGMHFPHDFGSIPGTVEPDGDPLDIMVLSEAPTFPGCLVTVRLLGVLRAQQREHGKEIRNDRLLGVAMTPVNESPLRELKSIARQQLEDIEGFFESYNRAQGRPFKITGRANARAAVATLARSIRRFSSGA